MKLKPSKKDIIPSITSALFFAWIALWLTALLLGWISFSIEVLFYLFLPVPWVILIIVVWVNWKNINSKILYPEYGKAHFDPLYIKEGLVRLFLIIFIFIIFIYYIMLQISTPIIPIPSGLLVVVNAILAYFGFKSSEILPKDYVIESLNAEVPSNKKLLTSLPVVKDAFNQFEVNLRETLDAIEKLIQDISRDVGRVTSLIDQRIKEINKIVNNIPYYSFSRDKFDKYSYLVLIILLAIINIILQPAFEVPSFIALPTFSIFGILIGVSARNKINGNISNQLSEDIQALKQELEKLNEEIKTQSKFTIEKFEELKIYYQAFMQGSFLEFLPANYSPLLSIGFVSFLTLFIFILPLQNTEMIFTTIQWFVIYYFTSKQ